MNRRSFLKSIVALAVTPVLLKGGNALPLEPQDILSMPEADLSSIGYFVEGLPVVGEDGKRFMGPIPEGAVLELTANLPGTEQAAWQLTALRAA